MFKCIDNKPLKGNEVAPPLEVGKEYELKESIQCNCGLDHYDVGLKSKYNYISCRSCGEKLERGESIHWCSPDRFGN